MKGLLFGIGIVVFLVLLMPSCLKDDISNGGGASQPQDLAAKFIGTWSVDDQAARLNYSVTIERHALYQDRVNLLNFADAGGKAVAIILGNALIIEKQPVGGGYESEGTGSYITSKKLQFEFFLDDGIDALQRNAVFTK
jgi:hypothetical protein